ncbi:hypothetical protein BCP78_0190 [Bacillus phage BCP78]|uniref:Uncharacterized protein n=3 Tax=Tsarbombavirus BCP78 TaxID=1985182 RepID=J9PRZ9_9CAUD|nr:hypothetical protein BCP78_0190 [Bacillus phage BCP78]YP_009783552.1 hypothetical protein QLX27_gp179 [Bacillus phage BCU4]AEW47197.1 hypothetical protein BCP78_0190 [Bacillus phage BCP78]AEW47685.1 hypothetical protein BCU4_0179 [Bacillus phage BCU4]AQN32565.1 hypothetical protein BCP12_153 [Bacillus phage BCP12]
MPIEQRDPQSGALIFVPTNFEKSTISAARQMKEQSKELEKKLQEVEDMKKQLEAVLKQAKEK